ncbi:MAG: response regulator transcription factor [Bdellovibrionaceae bacterium]|nr:response regulator transcription factor [Pseudobdellovibrionaceae bacterium]
MRRILLVEDDPQLGQNLRDRLAQEYHVSWAKSVKESAVLLQTESWDLAILDIGLPDGNGFDVASKIALKDSCHFIFLTAQSDAESRLKGFELGAQEFIPKPFYLKELLLRVKHVMDSHPAVARELVLKEVTLNLQDFSVKKHSGGIEYPPVTDMKILKFLFEKTPQVVSRDEILDHVWGIDKTPNHRTVDNAIVRLRQLLGSDGEKIRSVRGIGYQWHPEEEP